MRGQGRLELRVDDDSVWVTENLPYVVRDASSAFVCEGRTGSRPVVDLEAGYYSVELLTPAGEPRTEVVEVRAGETVPVVVVDDGVADHAAPAPPPVAAPPRADQSMAPPPMAPPSMPPAPKSAGRWRSLWPRARRHRPVAPSPAPPPPPRRQPPGILLDTDGCTAREDDDGWVFTPDEHLHGVPTARFRLDDPVPWVVSLALNPAAQGQDELRRCRVRVQQMAGEPDRPVATFSHERRVSRLLEGIVRHHQLGSTDMIREASELLLSKYHDPPAAALGGLTLHRLGRLRGRQDWVENLARDFSWLPDGQVLCAALLMHDDDPAERDRGLDLLLEATSQRPLYSDGLSLATDLLRRWPGDAHERARTHRLERLADLACTADWDAVMLTHREGG